MDKVKCKKCGFANLSFYAHCDSCYAYMKPEEEIKDLKTVVIMISALCLFFFLMFLYVQQWNEQLLKEKESFNLERKVLMEVIQNKK